MPGLSLRASADDLLVVVGPVVGCGCFGGVVDGAELFAQGLLDALLELMARQRQQRRDPLRVHVVVFHELLPGPFRQAKAQEPLALLQAHELRHVRGRQPHRDGQRAEQGVRRTALACYFCNLCITDQTSWSECS